MKILTLPTKKQASAMYEYNQMKYSKTNAYICWFFGYYRVYTKQYGIFILYLLSLFVYIGIARWIVEVFNVGDFVDQKNKEIDEMLYSKYS